MDRNSRLGSWVSGLSFLYHYGMGNQASPCGTTSTIGASCTILLLTCFLFFSFLFYLAFLSLMHLGVTLVLT